MIEPEIPGIKENVENIEKNPIVKPFYEYNKLMALLKKDVDSEGEYLVRNMEALNKFLEKGIYETSMIAIKYKDVLEIYKRLLFAYRNYSEIVRERMIEIKEIIESHYMTKKEHKGMIEELKEEYEGILESIKNEKPPKEKMEIPKKEIVEEKEELKLEEEEEEPKIKTPEEIKKVLREKSDSVVNLEKHDKELLFYDMKTKQRFKSNNYEIIERNGRRLAVTINPSGFKAFSFLGALKGTVSSRTIEKSRRPPVKKMKDIEDE